MPAYTGTMEQLYDIYFAGQLVEDFDEVTVRENLVKLFKTNDVALQKLFSGKPQPIKRGVDKAGAIKYKAAMAKAGAVAVVKAHPRAEPKAEPKIAEPAPAFEDDDLPSSADIKPAAEPDQGEVLAF
ncbi:MAG: hypothetical protein ACE1Y4_15450, partial [Lysobacterales bacterium]